MRYFFIILLAILAQLSSCNKEAPEVIKDENGVITSKSHSKLSALTDDFNDKAVLGVANHVTFEREALLPGKKNGDVTLKMISIDTGEELWEWNDPVDGRSYDALDSYVSNNYFVWDEGVDLYCVNLATGSTVWKNRYNGEELPYFQAINGIGTDIFIHASYSPYIENEVNFAKIYKTSVASGPAIQEVARVMSDDSLSDHTPLQIGVFQIDGGDTVIFTETYTYQDATNYWGYFNLYNYSKTEWIYLKKKSGIRPGSVARPKLHNGNVFMAMNPYIVAVDLMSGVVVWKRKMGENVNFYDSGFILVPDKNLIIFNAEELGTILYALDLDTGQEVWSEPSSGTSSHLQYLNGVVYWVGGGDGLLHAVDVDTGKHIWKISSPDLSIRSNAWFTRYCAVFPGENGEKGKVIVSSGLHAFAYEAER